MLEELPCPLCGAHDTPEFHADSRRSYRRCERCALVFVPPEYYLAISDERAIYDQHENALEDPGYRNFLNRLAEPLLASIGRAARGLDFGCGPGPALAAMLREAGHEVALYDPYYAPDEAVLAVVYDFICATEVVEHLHLPGLELARLWRLLRPDGLLGVMTKLVLGPEAFSRWHYKNDQTHVCFFSQETWCWWGREVDASVQFIGSDVVILKKLPQR